MTPDAKTMDLERAEFAAWGMFGLWTLACAWPAWTVAAAYHYALAFLYAGFAAVMASPRWSPGIAGCAGACLSSLALRDGADAHGVVLAVLGVLVSAVASALLLALAVRGDVDQDGRIEARLGCQQLTLTCLLAGWWSPVVVDLLGWLARG